MLRQEVLKLYREVVRTAYKVDKDRRTEIISWARSDFETHRFQSNEVFTFKFNNLNLKKLISQFGFLRRLLEDFFIVESKW